MLLSKSGDLRSYNQLLSALDIKLSDRLISIRENGNVDGNFILTHLIKQILQENNRICFLMTHNIISHYTNVGKKLGYDLRKAIDDRKVKTIEMLTDLADYLNEDKEDFFFEDSAVFLKTLCDDIATKINELKKGFDGIVYILIDDLTHLSELGIELEQLAVMLNSYIGMTDSESIALVVASHISTPSDKALINYLLYVCDVDIEVKPLTTGNSDYVSGVLNIQRTSGRKQYHYKTYDRGIKVFTPGECILNLFK